MFDRFGPAGGEVQGYMGGLESVPSTGWLPSLLKRYPKMIKLRKGRCSHKKTVLVQLFASLAELVPNSRASTREQLGEQQTGIRERAASERSRSQSLLASARSRACSPKLLWLPSPAESLPLPMILTPVELVTQQFEKKDATLDQTINLYYWLTNKLKCMTFYDENVPADGSVVIVAICSSLITKLLRYMDIKFKPFCRSEFVAFALHPNHRMRPR